MDRSKGGVRIALAALVLTVAAIGGAEARDIKVKRTATVATVVEPGPAAPSDPVAAATASAALQKAAEAVSVPACARKVKVIYAGYGEANRASCADMATAPSPTAVASR